MVNSRYAYYAFISYNHRNSKQAKWIQEELENFKFPTTLKKEYGSRIPDSLRPIFRDATDLNAGVLEENLKRELLDSRFLVVVCSPESAQSEWVNKEVDFFIQNGREDQIIPLIVAGKPDAADEKEQCFVPALRNLKKEILGISIPELGAEKALVKVVAKMLSLKFDQLWQRHERQKRRARRIKRSLASIMLLLLIGSGFFAWDYNREKISYYADFVDKWGVPTGIIPLTEEQVAHRQGSYRFVSKQGKTRRVEYVNSHGLILEENKKHSDYLIYGFYVPVNMKINYHEDGRVSNIAYFNERNARIFDLRFSKEGQNFLMEIKPRKKEWEKNFGELAESKVRIYSVMRDSSGFISRMMYRNAQEYLVRDKKKSFGEAYTRNSRGQILSTVHLDKSGQQMKDDLKYENVYDSLGYIQERSSTRKDEEKRNRVQRYSYDSWGNRISARNYDDEGNPQYDEEGVFEKKYEYDDFGNLIKKASFDANKELICGKGRRFAYTLMDYNEKGLEIKKSVYGIDGEPAVAYEGWFTNSKAYDDKGRLVKTNYWDKDGKPFGIEGTDVSEERYEYDIDGNMISESFFDANGNLTEKDGYASAKFEYDDKGNPIKLSYFDAQNAPATDIAEIIIEYDEQSNETKSSAYFKDGRLTTWDYNEFGSLVKKSFHGAKGASTKNALGFAAIIYKYDQYGNISKECTYDENQNKILDEGYACKSFEYDENGNAIRTVFEGTNGNAVKIKHGFSERRNEYDEKGNIIEEKYFDTNGNPVIIDYGYASVKKKYNKQNKLIEESYYDTTGNPIMNLFGAASAIRKFDDFGNLIEQAYFDTKGRLVIWKKTPCARELYEYDERNRLVKQSCHNAGDSEMWYTVTTYEGSKKTEKKYRPSGEPWEEN
jgi:YD repeat-containing protein